MNFRIFIIGLPLVMSPGLLVSASFADDAPTPTPRVCVGYSPNSGNWGSGPVVDDEKTYCAPGYAVMGVPLRFSGVVPAEEVRVSGADCCPLPEGVLSTKHVLSASTCPEGTVVTGHERTSIPDSEHAKDFLRCTEIDRSRFRLSTSAQGLSYGRIESDAAGTVLGISSKRFSRGQLPLAIRYGVGRISKTRWEGDGCVGNVPGALLVGKRANSCSGLLFAELLSANPTGESKILMLPDCDALDGPFREAPVCIKGERR